MIELTEVMTVTTNNKLIGMMLAVLLLLTPLTACGTASTETKYLSKTSDIYQFEDYESSELFDIVRVDLGDSYAGLCASYQFTYLSDGLKIKGYISFPQSAISSQEKYKCLLYNRGGNRDYGALEEDETAKLCIASDRIVIASQYRGGGGSEGEDQFGGDDMHDVIRLIDFCEKDFAFADMEDFCVAGASRGGMMTYLAAKQDSRVKRIVAVAAVSDLFQSYEEREDMRDVLQETIGYTPEKAPEEYEKRSAIFWPEEIRIPVLLIHSTGDKKVSYQQTQALYEKLKDVTDCTLITHDDDVHGFHQEDAQTIRDWLEK